MKTLKQQAAEIGCTIEFTQLDGAILGKRAKRRIARNAIANLKQQIADLEFNTGQILPNKSQWVNYGLNATDLLKFTKIKGRFPTELEYGEIRHCGNLEIWYDIHCNPDHNEPKKSVFCTSSEAFKYFNSL